MLKAGLNDDAGRAAYLAAFHAAQALAFELSGKVAKTHKGVQMEFLNLTKNNPGITPDHRAFLSRAYNFKAAADYETGPDSALSIDQASVALANARSFIDAVEDSITSSEPN